MGENSGIEWTDHTFNGWIGCTKVSPACDHCYAESMAKRYGWAKWGPGEERKRTSEANWRKPLAWDRKAKAEGRRYRIFANSLSDVFDAEVLQEWRGDLFDLIQNTRHLDWLLLTKRPQVAKKFFDARPDLQRLENVWLGTTVENQTMADLRIPVLLSIPAKVRFLSCEPLLGPINIAQAILGWAEEELRRRILEDAEHRSGHLDWVIAGGESGHGARPSHPDWFRGLRDQCQEAGVPFFFKQHGEWLSTRDDAGQISYGKHDRHGWDVDAAAECWAYRVGKAAAGAMLDGREWREFPT